MAAERFNESSKNSVFFGWDKNMNFFNQKICGNFAFDVYSEFWKIRISSFLIIYKLKLKFFLLLNYVVFIQQLCRYY